MHRDREKSEGIQNQEFKDYRDYEFENPERFKAEVPKGESDASGPCLRVALFHAGIDTNLPRWVGTEHLQEICEKLEVDLYGPGSNHDYKNEGNYVVGYIQRREDGTEFGHFKHTKNLSNLLEEVDTKDIFAIIDAK